MLELFSRIVSLLLGIVATLLLLAALNACLPVARAAQPLPNGVGALTWDNEPFCTAAVVGPRSAVTAAHCLQGRDPSEIELFVGPDVVAPREVARVVAVLPHPDYDPETYEHDIGRVIVRDPLQSPPLPLAAPAPGGMRLFDHRAGPEPASRSQPITVTALGEETFPFTSEVDDAERCQSDTGGVILGEGQDGVALTGLSAWQCGRLGAATRVDGYRDFITTPCGDVTWEGRCLENTAVWCQASQLRVWNCSEDGLVCSRDGVLGMATCSPRRRRVGRER